MIFFMSESKLIQVPFSEQLAGGYIIEINSLIESVD